jgi:N utilization substance protein B
MGIRRAGRECAVQFLYQIDLHPALDASQALEEFWKLNKSARSTREFSERLIHGVIDKKIELDAKIASLADNWDVKRLAAVDRNILRLAIYEMLFCDDIPPVVTINEAVDLAKRFSADDSGGFVNGILDKAKKELLRPARHPAGGQT